MSALRGKWVRLKHAQTGVWLPVLPPAGALIELAALMAAILIADRVAPNLDIANIEPSPFWIPVLLLSLQYGTVAGLLAAAAATLAYVFNGFPEQGIGENLFTYLLRIWALPILWIGVSLLVGQFRLRQIEVKQDLLHRLGQRSRERDSLAGYAANLEKRCARLEREISSGVPGAGDGVLEALARLQDQAVDLPSALGDFCRAFAPGGAMSIATVTPKGLETIATSGWPENAEWSHTIGPDDPLYRAMTVTRRPVSVFNPGDENILHAQGFAAHPVLAPNASRVVGMIKLERTDAVRLSHATAGHLGVAARSIAARLAEPRIAADTVVDGEQRAEPATEARPSRPTRGWRHVPWLHGARTEDDMSPGAGRAGEGGGRPRRSK